MSHAFDKLNHLLVLSALFIDNKFNLIMQAILFHDQYKEQSS